MSASKRRIARKIAMLVRMDATRSRMDCTFLNSMVRGYNPAIRYWESCMLPLGMWLGRRGHRGRALMALELARVIRLAKGGVA